MKKLFISIFVFFLMLASSFDLAASETGRIKFGILEQNNITETTQITKTSDIRFGFSVNLMDEVDHTCSFILYLPEPAKEIGGDLKQQGHLPGKDVYESNPFAFNGKTTYYRIFQFDDSDPLGDWHLDIFVDGLFIETISFEVMPPDLLAQL